MTSASAAAPAVIRTPAATTEETPWRRSDRPDGELTGTQANLLKALLASGSTSPYAALVKSLYSFATRAAIAADRVAVSAELQTIQSKQLTAAQLAMQEIKDTLACAVCGELALLPMVLGACGHVVCQPCLHQIDDVAFHQLTVTFGSQQPPWSARQHLLARRCPLCRSEIIGGGFPCQPLKSVAKVLVRDGWVELPIGAADVMKLDYERETVSTRHIAALQMGCYSQAELAKWSVHRLETTLTADDWRRGVYVLAEPSVSRVFFETFALTMHGRAGGVEVLVNASQRLLAIALRDPSGDKSFGPSHLCVRVGVDGRFTAGEYVTPQAAAATPTVTSAATTTAAMTATATATAAAK